MADTSAARRDGGGMVSPESRDSGAANALGARLRVLRKQAGITQERAAEVADMSRNHYQLLERGLSDRKKGTPANPRLSTLVALCEAYHTTVPKLMLDVFEPPMDIEITDGS